jgi:hypothetical protein
VATITRKITGGTTGAPFQSAADEIAKVGGVEEEFCFEGTATQYRLAGRSGTDYPTDGRWDVEPMSHAPFRSRLHVLRPGSPDAFNGTVVVMWNNVSVGQDNFTVGAKAARMIEDGFALVGVTAQKVGIDGLPFAGEESEYYGRVMERPPGLKRYDPERYGALEHPGDGYSYDIYTQAAQLLGPDRTGEIDPLSGLRVEHLVSMGGSQSACRQATYLNAIQPITSAFDGFLLLVYAGTPTALDPSTAEARLAEIGENTVDLLGWRTYLLRADLGVPIIIVNSEFEAEQCYPNTQADTELVRWWEFAGTGHIGLTSPEDLEVMAQLMPPEMAWCQVSFAPASRAALHALQRWLNGGPPPAHQPRLAREGDPPELPRDDHGNATGGIRLPDLEAPLGTHVGQSPRDGFVQLMGTTTPFAPEKVRALYPDHDTWLAAYRAATERLVETGVFLPDDADEVIARASTLELPV